MKCIEKTLNISPDLEEEYLVETTIWVYEDCYDKVYARTKWNRYDRLLARYTILSGNCLGVCTWEEAIRNLGYRVLDDLVDEIGRAHV